MPKLSEDTRLEVLNDHYKESVAEFKKTGKSRDNNFLYILILVGVMVFEYVSPAHSQSVLTQLTNNKLGITAAFSIGFLVSLTWVALLYAAINYFQAVINIEKQYNYTHDLEDELAKYYEGKAFTREGKAYLKDYPIFSDWLHIVYRTIFPLLLTVAITFKIFGEWLARTHTAIPLALDTVIYVALLVSIILYVYSLYKTEKHDEEDVSK
ncbi:MAG TPA: hypothetical protein VMR76_01430 [Candidatus Saccharimonadia bacterium]|nr:hypothetical protein [Candidatus Saccharimonadia bacterium]